MRGRLRKESSHRDPIHGSRPPVRLKEQPKACSCHICGNPRKYASSRKNALTLAERRSFIALAESWDFYDFLFEEDFDDESEYMDPRWDDDSDYDQTGVEMADDSDDLLDYDDLEEDFGDLYY